MFFYSPGTRKIPDFMILPHVMASSAMGLKLGVISEFLPPTYAKQMRPRSMCTMQRLSHVYLHAQNVVDAGDICN